MRLSALLAALPPELAPSAWLRERSSDDPVIRGLGYDSRRTAPGDLFVALRGSDHDGHHYLRAASALGAVAFLVEEADAPVDGKPVVVVPDARRALAWVATRFYGEPASEMSLIGITGTNGKTSTSYLVESILTAAGTRTGLVGTVEIRFAGETRRATNTTPESLDLQATLRAMQTRNVEAVVMEVSSHGLELGRVVGCRFRVGAITNLTQDHLDFHPDMDAYREAKALLFRRYLAPGGTAVIHVDDPSSEAFLAAAQEGGATLVRTSRRADAAAELRLLEADVRLDGTRARVHTPSGEIQLEVPLLGDFNLENLMVAVGVAHALGVPHEAVAEGVASCPQVPGRMEVIRHAGAPTVIVDYAHTPDAVAKLLAAVRPLATGRLLVVFGCGGDRDRAKRPLMAGAAAEYGDVVIATSDNPRTEDPAAILRDVEAGLERLDRVEPDALARARAAYAVIEDRRTAIEAAIAAAAASDTVVIAGKGHEDYQIVGREKLPFDDRREARRFLADYAREAGA